ncbi:hypothetical protein GMOD_00009324 [Pyrenophora seminiperda CCB06]|uniref:Uncharacterized protein n=1 Tax=Pyrenophora seminiperda CCB06 TaxID=1302712 RepID=A0A3M7MBP2_9PLEO|nr:hypothetical protein GMOD_00009324 [Pyrenophora seminiperda CCB06]
MSAYQSSSALPYYLAHKPQLYDYPPVQSTSSRTPRAPPPRDWVYMIDSLINDTRALANDMRSKREQWRKEREQRKEKKEVDAFQDVGIGMDPGAIGENWG